MQLPAKPEGDPDELRAAARKLRELAQGVEFKCRQPWNTWNSNSLGLGKVGKAASERLRAAHNKTRPLPALLRAVATQLDVAAELVEQKLRQWQATCRQIREREAGR